jgi:prophage DNA circulation protein
MTGKLHIPFVSQLHYALQASLQQVQAELSVLTAEHSSVAKALEGATTDVAQLREVKEKLTASVEALKAELAQAGVHNLRGGAVQAHTAPLIPSHANMRRQGPDC